MKQLLATALAAAVWFPIVPMEADAPSTFTLNSQPELTVIPYHSYYTYSLLTFDDQPTTGNAVEHLDTRLWEFSFPGLTLENCVLTSSTISPLSRSGPTYQTQTTVDNFACDSHSVQTVGTRHYKLVSCGRGGNACFAEITPRPAITGTVD